MAPNTPWKIVVVGCGGISKVRIGSCILRQDSKIVGLVDLNLAAAESRKEEFDLSAAETGTDLETMIRETGANVVVDCTIPETHSLVTCTAVALGCHVLGEKPMADTMENARKSIRAADDAGKVYAVVQNYRYAPGASTVRDCVRSGTIGNLKQIQSDFYIGAHFGGFRDQMAHVLILDMAIHTFDIMRHFTGLKAEKVYCREWNPPGSWYARDASAMAHFQLENNVAYTYNGSWCAEGCNTSWGSHWRFVGDKGTLLWHGGDDIRIQLAGEPDGLIYPVVDIEAPQEKRPPDYSSNHAMINEFFDALNEGRKPLTWCHDNFHSLAMVHAAINSSVSGQVVAVEKGL